MKFRVGVDLYDHAPSLPARGVRVEIDETDERKNMGKSLPARGVRVEILWGT